MVEENFEIHSTQMLIIDSKNQLHSSPWLKKNQNPSFQMLRIDFWLSRRWWVTIRMRWTTLTEELERQTISSQSAERVWVSERWSADQNRSELWSATQKRVGAWSRDRCRSAGALGKIGWSAGALMKKGRSAGALIPLDGPHRWCGLTYEGLVKISRERRREVWGEERGGRGVIQWHECGTESARSV
jgi:hypothetical protein